MKRLLLTLAFLRYITLNAQSQKEIGKQLFDYLKNDALILSEGDLIKGEQRVKAFVSDFSSSNGGKSTYVKNFSIEVNTILDYEIGNIQTNSDSFDVMFLKRKGDASGPKVEFLVIYKKGNSKNESSNIDTRRNEWMELCNSHKANELVRELYAPDAYYYNRGRLLQGTKAISAEYSYMNSPGYSLTLTPKHFVFVTSDVAYEIGRCSGSYPLPYMLLWEKQTGGNWQVLMDSNY